MALNLTLPTTSPLLSRPTTVLISPLPLASILDHHLRRNQSQDRVFGTLLGYKNPLTGEIEIKNSFGVPYALKGRGEINIDMDHHRVLVDLFGKVNSREVVVGWYATSPKLNSFSALIHNFYTTESTQSPAIHLTLDPITLEFITYTTSPIGGSSFLSSTSTSSSSAAAPATIGKSNNNNGTDHLIFLPILNSKLLVSESDRTGLDLLTSNLTSLNIHATTSLAQSVNGELEITSPLKSLYNLLNKVIIMLDSVLDYVNSVQKGDIKGDERVGRALMETVGSVPMGGKSMASKAGAGGGGGESKGFEEDFNAHLADVLMVSYLANLVKTQTEISSRLNLLV